MMSEVIYDAGKRSIMMGPMDEALEEPLSPEEAIFLQGEGSLHIVAVIGFDCLIDVETFKTKFPLTLLKHPRFSSVLVGDVEKSWRELKWVQIPHVDLDKHIIVPIIDDYSIDPDRYVEDYLHNLTKKPMDMSKPLWDFHVLNLKTSKADSIGIFRIHHTMGDGLSLISLLLACTRQVSNTNALPTIPTSKKVNEFKSIGFVLWWWLQVVWNTISGVFMFLATTMFLKDSNVFIMTTQETKIKPRRIVHKMISLDDMKLIKNAMNVTINDVAIGIIEAGLSKNLTRIYDDKKKEKSKNFFQNIRMRIGIVFNLRPFARIQSLDDMMDKNKPNGWGNKFGFVLLPLSIRSMDDQLEYVRKAKAKVDRKKQSLEAQYTVKIGEMAMKLFGIKTGAILSFKALEHISILVSNVPGPSEEISFFGHAIKYIAPSVYGVPQPVLVYLLSYTNKMSIVVSVREDVNVDAHQLCDDIVDSFAHLKDAIGK